MNNAEKFKQIFGLYATELWAMPEEKFLEWLNAQALEKQEQERWIPVTERLPENLEEVNITWVNTDPAPYYDFLKGKPFTGSAVYYKGDWYWYSSVTVDTLAEYGRLESEKLDCAIKVTAWKPLPEAYKEEEES